MGNEILIPVSATDETVKTRDQVLAGWKQLVTQVASIPLVFTAKDDTAGARASAEKSWYELADVVSNTPMVFTAEDGTGAARDKIETAWYEMADAIESTPIAFTAVDATAGARNGVERSYNDLVDEVETRPIAITAVSDVGPAVAQVEAAVAELNREVASTPTQLALGLDFSPGARSYAGAVPRMQELEQQPLALQVTATNPINDAFLAQVKASLKTISKQALEIPVNADTAPFLEQLDATLGELSGITKADIPVEIANAAQYRASVQELVAQTSQEVRETITVEADPTSLAAMKIQTQQAADEAAASASASAQKEAKAQQQLAAAQAAADAQPTTKSQLALAAAEEEAAAAGAANSKAQADLGAAEAVAASASQALAKSEDVAASASRGLGAAMGPMYMLMNVAQIAMMGMFMTTGSTAAATQDLSQQIIALGAATGATATSMLGGNANMQKMSGDLLILGQSGSQFAQSYSGSVATATAYTNGLHTQQQQLGDQMMTMTQIGQDAAISLAAIGDQGMDTTMSVKDLTDSVNGNHDAYTKLTPAAKQAVDQYNALNNIVPQADNALAGMKATVAANQNALEALGFTMNDGQQAANGYGLAVQSASKAIAEATAGAAYMENSTDKASITAGQGVQAWKQLQASVTSAGLAYSQAGLAVANAEHGVTTASQGVAAAVHSEQQAVLAVTTAQTAYTNAVYQEEQAQQAVTAARAAAEQQLISLKLQSDAAAQSADQAHLSLAQATQAAANVGVNSGNAQALADTPTDQINAGNMAQIAAADALIAAQNQVASAQDASTQAQSALNTARQQGVDNNPQVLSAEHALVQAQQGVASAAQGVTNAEYAQQQAVQAVANADYGLQQAEQGVTQAEQARAAAATALTTATDAESRSTDANTLVGAQNRQMLENIFNAYRDATGSEQLAAAATQTVGQEMGFTSDKITGVLNSLNGLNGTDTQFSITGTPGINPQQLNEVGQQIGISWAQIHAQATGTLAPASGRQTAKATGGPADGMVWVGEQGPELVKLAPGSSVLPHANSMLAAAQGYASGGVVGALGMNLPLAAQWGALDTVGQMWHAFGGPPVKLPPAGQVDLSGLGLGGGGSLAASSGLASAAQQYASSILSQFGWGQDQMPALIKLWNQESGWNPYAVNPSSGAYGIPQSLGHGHPYNLGDYIGQVNWGEAYVDQRYGSPNAAWAHEQRFNWYGAGGPVGADGWIGVGDGGPERIRVPGGSSVSPTANSHTANNPIQVDVAITFGGNTDSALASAFMKLVKAGDIQLAANGVRVKVG